MSLSDRLNKVSADAATASCKLGNLLAGDQLTAKEKTQIKDILSVPKTAPGRVSHSALAVILRDEGYDISKSSIDRHQRQECTCFRKAGK